MPLNFRLRTKARKLFAMIQERQPLPNRDEHLRDLDPDACHCCQRSYAFSPTCKFHPGICCECADTALRVERRTMSHYAS